MRGITKANETKFYMAISKLLQKKQTNKQSILSTYSTHSTWCSITTDTRAAVDGWGKCHEELHQGED